MFKGRADYIRRTFAPETEALRRAREGGDISISPETGKFLQMLIRWGNARRIVEIGTLAGYSALWIADALPDDGLLITLEKDPARAETATRTLHTNKKVQVVTGDAMKTLHTISDKGPFDIAFIDADKLNYLYYLDWAEKNVRKGGLIIGDNTFLSDAVWKDEPVERVRETARAAMRAFNLRLADPEKYTGILLDTPEGLTVAVKLF